MNRIRHCLRVAVSVVLLALPATVLAHEGDSEALAMRLHGFLLQLDRQQGLIVRETDPARRAALLQQHATLLLGAHEALQDVTEKSPCVLMEARDAARQLACLVDTEARLRAGNTLLGHVMFRLALPGGE